MSANDDKVRALAFIEQLSATAPDARQTLEDVKNELIGHELQKRLYVELGLIPPLVNIFENHGDISARREASVIIGSMVYGDPQFLTTLTEAGIITKLFNSLNPHTTDPELLLQSLRLLNQILDICTPYIRTSSCSQGPIASSKIVQTLYRKRRNIRNILDILRQETDNRTIIHQITEAAKLITQTVEFADFGGDGAHCPKLPTEAARRRVLVEHGVLDALVYRMGGFIVKDKRDHPELFTGKFVSEDSKAREERLREESDNSVKLDGYAEDMLHNTPPPASPLASLSPILEALLAITRDSIENTRRMHQATWLSELAPDYPRRLTPGEPKLKGIKKSGSSTNLGLNSSTAFPPLAAAARIAQLTALRNRHGPASADSSAFQTPQAHTPIPRDGQTNEDEGEARLADFENDYLRALVPPFKRGSHPAGKYSGSVLVPWLIARSTVGDCFSRLAAIGMLTNFVRVGSTTKKTPTILGLLVLPTLVRLLDGGVGFEGGPASASKDGVEVVSNGINRRTRTEWHILETAPKILAALVMDDQDLQKLAIDGHAMQTLAKLVERGLKQETLSHSADPNVPLAAGLVTATLLYNDHKLKMAEAAMRGLAALAAFADENRKRVVETGILPSVVTAMRPIGETGPVEKTPNRTIRRTVEEMYPPQVLIAACGLIRSLSRSISILRTDLMDQNIGTPLFELLTHPNIDVRIAATTVVCNLVLDFSPLKGPLTEAGVVDILCEHVTSSNPFMRVNAMWALKHVVYFAEMDVRMKCYRSLSPQWLYQLARDGTVAEETQRHKSQKDFEGDVGMGEPEGQDYEDASDDDIDYTDDTYESLEMEEDEDDDPFQLKTDISPDDLRSKNVPYMFDFPSNTAPNAGVKNSSYTKPSKGEREYIQQQIMGFFRNLFSGEHMEALVETVLNDFGTRHFVNLLKEKIAPRVERPRSEGLGYTRPSGVTLPARDPVTSNAGAPGSSFNGTPEDERWRICFDSSPETIDQVVYTVVHIAAQSKKLKDLLVHEAGDLLKLLTWMIYSPVGSIRRGVVWVAFNMIGVEEVNDDITRKERCQKMVDYGYVRALEHLLQDADQDIRERTRLALFELRKHAGFSSHGDH
ncbi:ARM repeat-containing protein [Ascobolus immersus RN42]|uniref:ARM repeat-containing protein n=1 Tax=Ascobolus immersus RN42 TaxID=1160509 RepID=A0A3N4IBD1_ASCIM|nr:ARM repeat-containing protein [Ascobolus immersus RN42]